jgi:hypothetical protein
MTDRRLPLPNDILEIFSVVFSEPGIFKVNDLELDEIKGLADKVCWSYSDLSNPTVIVKFSDDVFTKEGQDNITFNISEEKISYQLKAITLGLLHFGKQQGGEPLLWNSAKAIINSLHNFSRVCTRNGIVSFFDLNDQPALKLRTLLSEFIVTSSPTTITSYNRANAASSLITAGVVSSHNWLSALHDVKSSLSPRGSLRAISHPIIPANILKQLITDSCRYIDSARDHWPEYKQLIKFALSKVPESKSNKYTDLLKCSMHPNTDRIYQLRHNHFRQLSLHVSVLVLISTGMRLSELLSIKNYGARVKNDKGQTIYFIKAHLTNDLSPKLPPLFSRVCG